jgi:two-component system phosphate regulon response regulator OmpR
MVLNLKDYTLLIVDDDEDLNNTLCAFFTDEGATVFSATNGEEALQITLVEKVDIILSDIRMPIMDGIELTKSLAERDDLPPLVWLMTGQSELREDSALAIGAEGLLNKPFKLKTVLERIQTSLENRKL